MVPRLEGFRVETDYRRYAGLVKKGVAGFIVFGGEVEVLREGIRRLQEEAARPLIMASDLEQGLGQQVSGGTLFPPAMAMARAEAESPGLVSRVFARMAAEAAYAGINTIFAPVLDVASNPANPIISTRSFSADPETVSSLGCRMIRALREGGIEACGKHFPGHGDTSVDSHIALPVLRKPLGELEACELLPFRGAVQAGLRMVMLGHLGVAAIDPSGTPMSLSGKAVRFLREEVGFKGLTITDALNMGGVGAYSQGRAARMALEAGVDILLHPADPDGVSAELQESGVMPGTERLLRFREALLSRPSESAPAFEENRELAREVAVKALKVDGPLAPLKRPFVLILNDDEGEKGGAFVEALRKKMPLLKYARLRPASGDIRGPVPGGSDVIVAAFSEIKAWKGGASGWLSNALAELGEIARVVVSFGSPHLIAGLGGENLTKIYAYWGSELAEEAAAGLIARVMIKT